MLIIYTWYVDYPHEGVASYRPDLSRGAPWRMGDERFLVIAVTTGDPESDGTVFETAEGIRFVVTPTRTRAEANAKRSAAGPSATIFVVRPAFSMPAADWVAADPSFWGSPQITAKAAARQCMHRTLGLASIGVRRASAYLGMTDSVNRRLPWDRESITSAPRRACCRRWGGLERYAQKSGLEPALVELVKLRASQINGCAYCLDMHSKDARAAGESEQRIYVLSTWREAPFYNPRERAALAWTEAVTRIADGAVTDELYEATRSEFDEKEVVDLTMAIVTINGWNRLAISLGADVGSYEPATAHVGATAGAH